MDKNLLYRRIPRVDSLMREERLAEQIRKFGYGSVLAVVHDVLGEVREALDGCTLAEMADRELADIPERIGRKLEEWFEPEMKRVINGTGIILHTGLGRAPLGKGVMERAALASESYSNLEYDLKKGMRGERSAHFERLICHITGAQAAVAVNNNAAAVLLILTVLAEGGEVIVSRGELVEIGGKFRVPDMMELSGAKLREVGTTNRTRISDYENAVCEETKMFLKVHTSNYRIVGFTEEVPVEELCRMKKRYKIPVVEDLGSGVLLDLEAYGLKHEPTVQEVIRQGADLVCFSGDKLMGGPQAGIIAGRKDYIEKIKRHPLMRVLRIDKMTTAALETVLLEYLEPKKAVENIPVLRMLTRKEEDIRKDAEKLAGLMRESAAETRENRAQANHLHITVEKCVSRAGGGALPMEDIPSFAIAVSPEEISAGELSRRLRHLKIPVIGRVYKKRLLLDVRTLEEKDFPYLAEVFCGSSLFGGEIG